MYKTIEETADYLAMEPAQIFSYIIEGKIRAVHDGERYLVNQDQFVSHFEDVKKYREMIIAYLNTPLPEDRDVHDEDE